MNEVGTLSLNECDITNKDTPKIYLFLTNTDAFYDKYCRNLDNFKLFVKKS